MRQNLRAVQALPPERIEWEFIGLIPADFDRKKILQTRQLHQLRQIPRVAKDIRQPQHGGFRAHAKFLGEVIAPQQKLAGQRFAAADVAIGFDPHAADDLPATLEDAGFNRGKQLGVIGFDVFVQLRLALREMKLRVCLELPQNRVEGPARFAARLRQCPQPRHINVRVTSGDDFIVQR